MKKLIPVTAMFLAFACGDHVYKPKWENYDSGLKSRIDNSNCEDLQKEFDAALSNSGKTKTNELISD